MLCYAIQRCALACQAILRCAVAVLLRAVLCCTLLPLQRLRCCALASWHIARDESQAAGSFTDHIQQPVTAPDVLSNTLPAELAHKSSEGTSLLAKFKSLPEHAQQDTVLDSTLDSTELARGQGRLKPQHAQHASAPQHAECRQRSQHTELSTHAGFTATVSMTAKCRHQSPESCNSSSSIVSQCCATVRNSEVNSSLSIHASLSSKKLGKAVKHGRQGEVAKQSVLLADQRESVPAQLQLHLQEQLPNQSCIMTGQCDCMPAQLQLQEELPMKASPNAAPFPSAGLQELSPVTTQSPQPVASYDVRQLVSNIVSSKSLSRASSIVAAQQAVSRSSSTVSVEPHSLQGPRRELPQVPQGSGPTQPQQQAEAGSCATSEQLATWPEPVCPASSGGSICRLPSQAAAGREPPERKPSLPAVLCRTSSNTMLTSASQNRVRHDGRLGSAQQAAPQARSATLPGSDSASSARHGAESSASQPQPASLPHTDSASSARLDMHAERGASQPQLATLPGSDSASSARRNMRAESSAPPAQPPSLRCTDAARHGLQAESSALQPQLAAPSGSGSTGNARRADLTVRQPHLAAVVGSDGAGSAKHGMHSMDSCRAQLQPHEQTGPDTSGEGNRQQGVLSTAGTQQPQLQQGTCSDSRSSSMHLKSLSDLSIQQEGSQADCSSGLRCTFSQSSGATQQDAQQPDRHPRQQLLQPSNSAEQEVLQPEHNSYHGASSAEGLRAEGLALLQEQSQLALATQGSCSELSREGLEEDNCRLRRALAAIEQQLGVIRNQQVT